MIFKKVQYTFSIILIIFFVSNFIWNRFLFFPLILEPKTSKHCFETYFVNNMGGYIWKPLHPVAIGEKTLFYFNDTCGNCSTRFVIVRDIHRHYFPDFTVVQLEYPGFGISTHFPLEMTTIIDECKTVVSNLIKQYNIQYTVFWGEGMGTFIMSQVLKDTPIFANEIYFHNGINDLYQYLFLKFKFWVGPFLLLSFKKWKHTSEYLKMNTFNTKYRIISTENPIHQYQCYEFYYEIKDKDVKMLELEGEGSYGILFEKNRSILDSFLKS